MKEAVSLVMLAVAVGGHVCLIKAGKDSSSSSSLNSEEEGMCSDGEAAYCLTEYRPGEESKSKTGLSGRQSEDHVFHLTNRNYACMTTEGLKFALGCSNQEVTLPEAGCMKVPGKSYLLCFCRWSECNDVLTVEEAYDSYTQGQAFEYKGDCETNTKLTRPSSSPQVKIDPSRPSLFIDRTVKEFDPSGQKNAKPTESRSCAGGTRYFFEPASADSLDKIREGNMHALVMTCNDHGGDICLCTKSGECFLNNAESLEVVIVPRCVNGVCNMDMRLDPKTAPDQPFVRVSLWNPTGPGVDKLLESKTEDEFRHVTGVGCGSCPVKMKC